MSTPESTGPQSADRIRQAIWENRESPNGLPRNSRAEELVSAAEQSGEAELIRLALFNLIDAYEFSTERGKLIVPFARLLQEWDRDPSGFDQWDVQSLHWRFKWVGSGMLDLPEIPLDSIRQWQQEMGRRFAVAGYSPRAVRQSAYYLAYEIGDDEAADRHLAEWTAADRDQMSDCHACELNEQGGYWARRGEDEKALDTWAPVLDGTHTCAEEPHRVLAEALVPLVRLGRLDEARASHLRGYRMAKGNESLLRSIGHHLEFCALTGNEARGLEILAEHATHLGPLNDADAQLGFGGGALVLLGRLKELGHGSLPAARYQGTDRTVAELHDLLLADLTALTARFDARNGTAASSTRLATRLGQRPLVEVLPLGVRAAVPVAAGSVRPGASVRSAAPAPSVAEASTAETVEDIAVRARELRAAGHPAAAELWERIAVLSAREDASVPDRLLSAELLEHRALTIGRAGGQPVQDGTARRLFEEVVAAFRAIDEPGRAAVNGVRIAVAAVQQGAPDEEIRAALDAAATLVEEIPVDDPLRLRRVATLDLTRIKLDAFVAQRAHAHRGGSEHDGGSDAEAGARFLAAMSGFVTEYGTVEDAGALADLVAEAEAALAHEAVNTQDGERAEALLISAARRNQDTGRPWEAVEPLTRLARLRLMLGRPDLAEEVSRTALECAADLTDADELGTVRLTLAEALYQQDGKESEAATYALEAAHWFDAAGEGAGAGAYARLVLAQAFGETGRAAEAAEILESALPDLLEHGDEQAVRARDTLGRMLRQLGDEKAAAQQYLLAAELAEAWDHPAPKARLAMLAGECLAAADGLEKQAEQAYERAVELWREAGETFGHVRALRALAWLAVETRYDEDGVGGEDEDGVGGEDEDGVGLLGDVDRARALMVQALAALDEDGPEHRLERARTWSQLSQLLYNEDGLEAEAAELGIRAAEALREFGPEELPERASCVLRSAWAEQDRGRKEEGRALLAAFVDELKVLAEDSDEAAELLKQVEQRVEHYG
ncbi:tetratricopeptide repeat protein [Streptomyces sp. NBC_00237]|uniref:tetratricopeptide repeat protein n=1 Tax=Streptomyces sp. NBC_00237 TaxID=2975687 RepID=UPI00225443F6|nr:tetratricopeptide repeat protein [Streptomyces sp. NBC_00237]MCX5200000.1 tetratricopeptide repeat protein [Streptomyces sp. NBC_00237]